MKSIKYVAEDGQWSSRIKRGRGEEKGEGQEVSMTELVRESKGRREEDGCASICSIKSIPAICGYTYIHIHKNNAH